MLSESDRPIEQESARFAKLGVDVAFISPTATGIGKSIMDAVEPLRDYLLRRGVHDYGKQAKGTAAKVVIKTLLFSGQAVVETETSLYRPTTKDGDPRIWVKGMKPYVQPKNLLAILADGEGIVVINLSTVDTSQLAASTSPLGRQIARFASPVRDTIQEIVDEIRRVTDGKFIRSLASGNRAVGETLELLLGLTANSSKKADLRGVELKAQRMKTSSNMTLFCEMPDPSISPIPTLRAICERFAYIDTNGRRALRITVQAKPPHAKTGLYLRAGERKLDPEEPRLGVLDEMCGFEVIATWRMATLRQRVIEKLSNALTVQAECKVEEGVEYFRYFKAEAHGQPNVMALTDLLNTNKMVIDHRAVEKTGGWKDKGLAFRMHRRNLELLLPAHRTYDLTA